VFAVVLPATSWTFSLVRFRGKTVHVFVYTKSYGRRQVSIFNFHATVCHRLFLVGFERSKNGCTVTVPPNTVLNQMFIAVEDFERGGRALVPAARFLQDRFDILGYRALTQAGISNGKSVSGRFCR
jgi:hypothetical protein